MEIASYGEHNKFLIGSEDFEAAMCLLVENFGLQPRIILALIVAARHPTGLIEQSWMKILGSIISTGNIYCHCDTGII